MTKEQKRMVLIARLNHVKSRGKYLDCPGVVKKLERQIRNLEED